MKSLERESLDLCLSSVIFPERDLVWKCSQRGYLSLIWPRWEQVEMTAQVQPRAGSASPDLDAPSSIESTVIQSRIDTVRAKELLVITIAYSTAQLNGMRALRLRKEEVVDGAGMSKEVLIEKPIQTRNGYRPSHEEECSLDHFLLPAV
jgi:hypothetical protein